MIKTKIGPKGKRYAIVDNVRLHSPYYPQREADRFVRIHLQSPPAKIILLGPGLGYLIKSLQKLFPSTDIIAVFYEKTFFLNCNDDSIQKHCFIDGNQLRLFLHNSLHDIDIEGLSIIEWPECAKAFPDISQSVNSILRNIILELHGNFITTDSFGKKMFLNSLKNFLFHQNIFSIAAVTSPLVVVASGPSLETSLPFLHRERKKCTVLALPSSLDILYFHDFRPDAVLLTDAGYFSKFHTRSLYRLFPPSMPIIKSLSSVFEQQLSNDPTMFIGWNPVFEKPFLDFYHCNNYIPENGTVAGTAFELGCRYDFPSIFFVGLDFSYKDLLSHARPHPFYRYFLANTRKHSPYHSELFSRYISFCDHSKSFKTYITWFEQASSQTYKNVYRVNPNDIPIHGLVPIAPEDLHTYLQKYPSFDNSFCFEDSPLRPFTERKDFSTQFIDSVVRIVNSYKHKAPLTFRDLYSDKAAFDIFYTLNPIKIKQFKKLSRDNKSEASSVFQLLLDEILVFFDSINTWINSL